jgi:hypothetical protein
VPAQQQSLSHITAHTPQANHAKFHNTPSIADTTLTLHPLSNSPLYEEGESPVPSLYEGEG